MDNLFLQAVFMTLIAFFGYMHSFMGSTMHNRPIIIAPLVGLVLGDLTSGVMIGATLELVWMGAFPIGASNPPDMVSGGVIGTAFAIIAGQDISSAVILAVPVATLVLMFDNVLMTFFIPALCAKADKYAETGDYKGVERMHYAAVFGVKGILALVVGLGFYFGQGFVTGILEAIPGFVSDGLDVATGLIPAIGFALLARMIINKKLAPYFFIGFLLTAYINVPLLGVALFGVMTALLLVSTNHGGTKKEEVYADDNEF